MKMRVIGLATLGMVVSSQVLAQTVVISPEERTIIHEYVLKEKIRPHKFKEHVVVGAKLPEDVQLAPIPEAWGPALQPYRYVYSDDHIILVDPSTRRVVQLIELELGPHGA